MLVRAEEDHQLEVGFWLHVVGGEAIVLHEWQDIFEVAGFIEGMFA